MYVYMISKQHICIYTYSVYIYIYTHAEYMYTVHVYVYAVCIYIYMQIDTCIIYIYIDTCIIYTCIICNNYDMKNISLLIRFNVFNNKKKVHGIYMTHLPCSLQKSCFFSPLGLRTWLGCSAFAWKARGGREPRRRRGAPVYNLYMVIIVNNYILCLVLLIDVMLLLSAI